MTRHKPFSKTEMKILIFNKVKRGMSYDQACRELEKEMKEMIKNSKEKHREKEIKPKKDKFKEDFAKLTNGK